MEIIQSPEVHDVVVVGSGASGGMAAYNLTQKGVRVLMLDAGDKFDRDKFWTHVLPFEADERLRRGDSPPPFFLDKKEQPYLTPEGKPFNLVRVWGMGGKTNVWGRVSLRMSDLDFGAAERDGWGTPGPSATPTSLLTTTRSSSSSVSAAATTARTYCREASTICPRPRLVAAKSSSENPRKASASRSFRSAARI